MPKNKTKQKLKCSFSEEVKHFICINSTSWQKKNECCSPIYKTKNEKQCGPFQAVTSKIYCL